MPETPKEVEICKQVPVAFPPQSQAEQPGLEYIMTPRPVYEKAGPTAGKLKDKVAIITGGDSGIGRAVSVAFAQEGADVALLYASPREQPDAMETVNRIYETGRRAIAMQGDVRDENFCRAAVNRAAEIFGRLDILVNNAAVIHVQNSIEDITAEQLAETFGVNILAYFYMVKAVLPYFKGRTGCSIINTSSVTAYEPYTLSLDYSATKGAVVAFTRSLAQALIPLGIRVNTVAPGMTWTPFIPSSQSAEQVMLFGRDRPMGRAAQPVEIAPSYVFLASDSDSSYMTGQAIVVT